MFFLALPKPADKVLKPLNQWINKNVNCLIAGFLIIIGLFVIYNGLGRLGMVKKKGFA